MGWDDGANDYGPFVRYMLGVTLAAYRDLDEMVSLVVGAQLSKPRRVEKTLRSSVGKVTKSMIVERCPDISVSTIERTLAELLAAGKVQKVGAGRGTGYIWKG